MRSQPQPVPVGGWNASMPLNLMPPTDAVRMINFLPREETIEFRKGTEKITTSALGTEVETLVTHVAENASETLLAASDGHIYRVNTNTGATTSKGSGYSNNRWQTVNFNNLLLLVNGEDAPQQFDGTTLGNFTSGLTGVTPENVNGVMVFKGRAIYWENNAAKFWYAAAGAYGGAVTDFPLDLTTQKGGYVVECCTWTRDSGDGADDLFVVLMSTGETLVYSGNDPGSNFSLIGKFNLGRPICVRGSTKLTSDRIILTEDGFVNLSTALQVDRASEGGNVGSKIINEAKKATNSFRNNYGWEIFYHDRESLLIVNIPRYVNDTTPDESQYEQYCMNTNTGAWTRLNGINAITFSEQNGRLYAGGSDGHIRRIFKGTSDDSVPIRYSLTPAFSDMGMPGRKKQLTYVTIITDFNKKENIGIAGLSDFEPRAFGNATVPDTATGNVALWGLANWGEFYWGAGVDVSIKQYHMPVSKAGYTLSCKINILSETQTSHIYAMNYKYKIMRTI